MQNSETMSRTQGSVSSVSEVKAAIHDFMNNFNAFQSEVKSKINNQEERLKMLDRKSQTVSRPALAMASEAQAPHQKAFNDYIRSGDDDGLRGLEVEVKGLSTAVNSDGGFLVDPQTSQTVQSSLKGASLLRAIANVVTVEATSYDVLVDHSDLGAGWASENGTPTETDTPQIDRISIPLHELSALPKASPLVG